MKGPRFIEGPARKSRRPGRLMLAFPDPPRTERAIPRRRVRGASRCIANFGFAAPTLDNPQIAVSPVRVKLRKSSIAEALRVDLR